MKCTQAWDVSSDTHCRRLVSHASLRLPSESPLTLVAPTCPRSPSPPTSSASRLTRSVSSSSPATPRHQRTATHQRRRLMLLSRLALLLTTARSSRATRLSPLTTRLSSRRARSPTTQAPRTPTASSATLVPRLAWSASARSVPQPRPRRRRRRRSRQLRCSFCLFGNVILYNARRLAGKNDINGITERQAHGKCSWLNSSIAHRMLSTSAKESLPVTTCFNMIHM